MKGPDAERGQVEREEVPRDPYCAKRTYEELVQWIASSAPKPGEYETAACMSHEDLCREQRQRILKYGCTPHHAKRSWQSRLCDLCIATLCRLLDFLEAFHAANIQLLRWFGKRRERISDLAASETSKPEHIP